MKICFVRIMPYPSTIGGGTTYMNTLISSLINKGHEVYVITSKSENQNRNKDLQLPNGVKIIPVGIPHKKFGKGFPLFDISYRAIFELSFMIDSLIRVLRIKPDIVHTQTLISESLPFALFNTPFVATAHGIHFEGFETLWKKRKNKFPLLISKVLKPIEKFNAKRCKKVICINDKISSFYSKFTSTVTIPNSIEINAFSPEKKIKNQYLSLSRLTEQKGLKYLIEALSILDKRKINIKMIIAGAGDEEYVSVLKKEAVKLKNIKVIFPGQVLGSKKSKLYSSSGVFIVPSIFEPFGITLLEAMASGCAVIASNTEGPSEIIKKNFGILVDYANEESRALNLANAIEKSLKWNIKKMGAEALKEVKKYDSNLITNKYVEVYKNVR